MIMNAALFFLVATLVHLPQASCQCFSPNDREDSNSTPSNVQIMLHGFSDFAIKLYKNLAVDSTTTDEDVFFSPISVWSALTATYIGSNGTTQEELATALGIKELAKRHVANAYRVLRYWYFLRTSDVNANYTFKMANKLYFHKDENIHACIARYFSTELKTVDFAGNPEGVRQEINAWIEEQTNGKIRDMLPRGVVDQTTRLVLVNAAYFKGDWERKFDARNTRKKPFHASHKKDTQVLMMELEADIRYGYSDELGSVAVELPYSGGDLSMVILLPTDNTSIDEVVQRLTPRALLKLINEMQIKKVKLFMPKFKIQQTLELSDTLSAVGIRSMFNPFMADLSGFTGKNDLSVSSVQHKAFIEVNEEGSEAAASTSILSFRDGNKATIVNCNRPFMFLIRDSVLDTILFTGLVRNPM